MTVDAVRAGYRLRRVRARPRAPRHRPRPRAASSTGRASCATSPGSTSRRRASRSAARTRRPRGPAAAAAPGALGVSMLDHRARRSARRRCRGVVAVEASASSASDAGEDRRWLSSGAAASRRRRLALRADRAAATSSSEFERRASRPTWLWPAARMQRARSRSCVDGDRSGRSPGDRGRRRCACISIAINRGGRHRHQRASRRLPALAASSAAQPRGRCWRSAGRR